MRTSDSPEMGRLAELAGRLREGDVPSPAELLKSNPVRRIVRADDTVLKLFLGSKPGAAAREAAALREAATRGIPVPALLGQGPDWLATRWCEGRPAAREDLPRLLDVVTRMHEARMLHRDLHLGNFLITGDRVLLLDLQRSVFLPLLPHWLRRWELGRLAYSLGEPLPETLARVRFWRDQRAHQHWRSRSKRCLKESSRFTAFSWRGARGFRLRETDPEALVRTLEGLDEAELIWSRPGGHIYRSGPWIAKQHASERDARNAWRAGHALEARGIRTALAIAWVGPWLVMQDAGRTIVDWIEESFSAADVAVQDEMMRVLSDLMADLHRRGIYHADLKACNVVWSPGSPPLLLDYERVLFRRTVSRRRRMKNLAQLNSALPDTVSTTLREQALQRYVERSPFRGDVGRLRRDVIALSLKRAHRWSGC